MGRKFLAVSFSAMALCGLTFCVGSDPAPVSDTPTDEAGTPAETGGGTETSTAFDTGGGPDVSLDDSSDGNTGPKQAFVTDAVFYGDMTIVGGGPAMGGVAGADKRCMEAAATKFPGRTFHALVAGTGVNALTHIGAGPWYVGPNLLGSIANLTYPQDPLTPLNVTETGKGLDTSQTAWVGADYVTPTKGDVEVGYNCTDWSVATDDGVYVGTVSGTGGTWFYAGALGCNNQRHLYCFEQ